MISSLSSLVEKFTIQVLIHIKHYHSRKKVKLIFYDEKLIPPGKCYNRNEERN